MQRTKGCTPRHAVIGLVWYTHGSRMRLGTWAKVSGRSFWRRLSFSLGRITTGFQAEIYAILAWVCEIRKIARSEKHITICCDSEVALKAIQALKTTSPLFRHFQWALNDLACYSVRLIWVSGHSGVSGSETADKLVREVFAHRFVVLEQALGISRQNIRQKIISWLFNQHIFLWQSLTSTQKQAWELSSGPNIADNTKLLP